MVGTSIFRILKFPLMDGWMQRQADSTEPFFLSNPLWWLMELDHWCQDCFELSHVSIRMRRLNCRFVWYGVIYRTFQFFTVKNLEKHGIWMRLNELGTHQFSETMNLCAMGWVTNDSKSFAVKPIVSTFHDIGFPVMKPIISNDQAKSYHVNSRVDLRRIAVSHCFYHLIARHGSWPDSTGDHHQRSDGCDLKKSTTGHLWRKASLLKGESSTWRPDMIRFCFAMFSVLQKTRSSNLGMNDVSDGPKKMT